MIKVQVEYHLCEPTNPRPERQDVYERDALNVALLEGTFGALEGQPTKYTNRFFAAGTGLNESYKLKDEAYSIFGQVDGRGRRAKDRHACCLQTVGQVERCLAAKLYDDPGRLFDVDDRQHILKRHRLKNITFCIG